MTTPAEVETSKGSVLDTAICARRRKLGPGMWPVVYQGPKNEPRRAAQKGNR